MLSAKFDEQGNITELSKIQSIGINLPDNFFDKYSANCWRLVNGELVLKTDAQAIQDAEIATANPLLPVTYDIVTVNEFKLALTVQERIALKTSTDIVIQDFYEIVQDQRTTHVHLNNPAVQEALAYITAQGVWDSTRENEILNTVSSN